MGFSPSTSICFSAWSFPCPASTGFSSPRGASESHNVERLLPPTLPRMPLPTCNQPANESTVSAGGRVQHSVDGSLFLFSPMLLVSGSGRRLPPVLPPAGLPPVARCRASSTAARCLAARGLDVSSSCQPLGPCVHVSEGIGLFLVRSESRGVRCLGRQSNRQSDERTLI